MKTSNANICGLQTQLHLNQEASHTCFQIFDTTKAQSQSGMDVSSVVPLQHQTTGSGINRKHSSNTGRYHKKIQHKEFGKKRNEYDEKFVAEMSVSEKDIDSAEFAAAISFDDGSFDKDDSSQFEADLSCELTEFEKEILSKYLSEYQGDEKSEDSTNDLDQMTKCEEIEDQIAILPTTIEALEVTETKKNVSTASDDCPSSSYNSDELIQEELVNVEELQQFAKEYQIGTSSSNNDYSEFVNNRLIASSSSITASLSTTSSQSLSHESTLNDTLINDTTEQDKNNNSLNYDTNNNNLNNRAQITPNNTHRRAFFRNNFTIWVGITSCVWGLIIYLMKSYT